MRVLARVLAIVILAPLWVPMYLFVLAAMLFLIAPLCTLCALAIDGQTGGVFDETLDFATLGYWDWEKIKFFLEHGRRPRY